MNLPAPPSFRAEDFPDVEPRLLELLTRGFRDLYDAMSRIPQLEQLPPASFTTDSNGDGVLELRNPLPQRPSSVNLDELRADDGAAISTAYAWGWVMTSDLVRVSFTGLPASSKFFCTVTVK